MKAIKAGVGDPLIGGGWQNPSVQRGAPKWTAKRMAGALAALAKGEKPVALVRDPRLGPRLMDHVL